jgi:glycerol kinase
VYESIAFRSQEVFESLSSDSNIKIKSIKVDGGLVQSNDLLQTQSDISQIKVQKPKEKEITTIGAAIVAGLSQKIKIFENFDQVKSHHSIEKCFEPIWKSEDLNLRRNKWEKAISKARNWV